MNGMRIGGHEAGERREGLTKQTCAGAAGRRWTGQERHSQRERRREKARDKQQRWVAPVAAAQPGHRNRAEREQGRWCIGWHSVRDSSSASLLSETERG